MHKIITATQTIDLEPPKTLKQLEDDHEAAKVVAHLASQAWRAARNDSMEKWRLWEKVVVTSDTEHLAYLALSARMSELAGVRQPSVDLSIVFAGSEDADAEREWQDQMAEAVEESPEAIGWDAEHPCFLRQAEESDAQATWEKNF